MASPPIDRAVRDAAGRSHDVITWPELKALGVTKKVLPRLVRDGVLRPLWRGVYTTARVLSQRGRFRAATAVTDGALSHRSAARLHGILRIDYGPVHVTSQNRARDREGIKVHHGRLHDWEITEIQGIPVTILGRVLLDIAETETGHRLHKAIDASHDLELYDQTQIDAVLTSHPHRTGSRILKPALTSHQVGAYRGENPFEDLLVPLLEANGLPLPKSQYKITLSDGTAIRPDAVWPRQRLIVELDGGGHFNERRSRHDHRRDVLLNAIGWTVLRFSWHDLTNQPAVVVAALRHKLAPID